MAPLLVLIVLALLAFAIVASLLVLAAVRLLQRHLEPPETSRLELMRRILEADVAKESSPPDRVRS